MPSSTSSSERDDAWGRLPEGFGPARALLALLLGLGLVAAGELFWRGQGIRPSAPDTVGLWRRERDLALAEAPTTVAVLGSSRAILGIDPEAARAVDPALSLHQLAIYGSSPVLVLRHLARETDFDGLALVEFGPIAFLDSDGRADRLPASWIRMADRLPLYSDLESLLRARVHLALASRRPNLTPLEVLKDLVRRGELPRADHLVVRADRHLEADFGRADRDEMVAFRLGNFEVGYRARGEAEFAALLDELAELVARIAARGGRVVFLQMPVDGETRALEDERCPRAQNWDRLLSRTGAVGLHYLDHPELAAFRTGDGSHLDRRDAPAFTRALLRILGDRGLLPTAD